MCDLQFRGYLLDKHVNARVYINIDIDIISDLPSHYHTRTLELFLYRFYQIPKFQRHVLLSIFKRIRVK